jgi:hypothetical protein
MDAYPISDAIKDPDAEGRHLINPVEPIVKKEYKAKAVVDFGHYGGWRLKVN